MCIRRTTLTTWSDEEFGLSVFGRKSCLNQSMELKDDNFTAYMAAGYRQRGLFD